MFKDLIMTYLKDTAIDQVSKTIGIDPSLLKGKGGEDAVSSLIGGLFNNTQKEEQLTSLDKAVEEDHDGSIFDNLTDLLTKGQEGGKIVDHILGDKQSVISSYLAKQLGITESQANMLLSYVAPMVMGALGKVKKETGADANQLRDLIGQEENKISQESKTPGIVLQLLDKDGDGDVDIADFLA